MRDSRGFSLAEVLVALLIITMILTASMAAFVERNRRMQQASEMIVAYQALANEAEYQRRIPFAHLHDNVFFVSLDPKSRRLLVPLGSFGTAIKVEDIKPGVKHVTMSLRWHNGQRVARLTLVRVDTGGTNLW